MCLWGEFRFRKKKCQDAGGDRGVAGGGVVCLLINSSNNKISNSKCRQIHSLTRWLMHILLLVILLPFLLLLLLRGISMCRVAEFEAFWNIWIPILCTGNINGLQRIILIMCMVVGNKCRLI